MHGLLFLHVCCKTSCCRMATYAPLVSILNSRTGLGLLLDFFWCNIGHKIVLTLAFWLDSGLLAAIKIAQISILPPLPSTIGRSSIDFAQICFKFGMQNCSKFDQNCSNFDLAPSANHNWSLFDRLCTNLLQTFTKFQQNCTDLGQIFSKLIEIVSKVRKLHAIFGQNC